MKRTAYYGVSLVVLCVMGCIAYIFLYQSDKVVHFKKNKFDSYVHTAMKDWHVPGCAVAIVKDGDIVHLKGYGVQREGGSDRVDEQTIFAIGSCSKAFTAASLGMLVDEKKVSWESKVHSFLSGLQFPDAYMTREITICDLLSHRSCLQEVGMLWDHTTLSQEDLLARIRYLQPKMGFREGWVYNNLMFLAAGSIIPVVTGLSWNDFVQERIFKPLGMVRSCTSVRQLPEYSNVAMPHCLVGDHVRMIPYHNIDCIAPAGAINASITDMAQWVKLHVNKGMHNGVQLISHKVLQDMYSPQSIMSRKYPFVLYCLGLGVSEYHGNQVVFHEGNIDGMSATFGFIPEENLGVMILTNMHKGTLGKVLLNTIFDTYLSIKPATDWNKTLLMQAHEKKMAALEDRAKREAMRKADVPTSVSLAQYAGVYHSPLYGDCVVQHTADGMLHFTMASFIGVLSHWQGDTFVFEPSREYPLFTDLFTFEFKVDRQRVASLRITYSDEMDAEFVKK